MRRLNRIFTKKGLRALLFRCKEESGLAYVYRPELLRKVLAEPLAAVILKEEGYPAGNVDVCLTRLAKRLCENRNFPHEIGLFLGYPPEDVRAFMLNPSEGVKFTGYWKAYNNVERAKKICSNYRKCTNAFCKAISNGQTLEQLIA